MTKWAEKGHEGIPEQCGEISFAETKVTLLSAMKPENEVQLKALAAELAGEQKRPEEERDEISEE